MDSQKNIVRCTIDFLLDEDEYDAMIAFRSAGEDGWHGCREQRFTTLRDACAWMQQVFPEMKAAWTTMQQPAPDLKESAELEQPDKSVSFHSTVALALTSARNSKGRKRETRTHQKEDGQLAIDNLDSLAVICLRPDIKARRANRSYLH